VPLYFSQLKDSTWKNTQNKNVLIKYEMDVPNKNKF